MLYDYSHLAKHDSFELPYQQTKNTWFQHASC